MKDFTHLIVILMAALLCSCGYAEKERHLFREGFIGIAYIVFDYEIDNPTSYEGEYRQYLIPETGILKTQFTMNLGPVQIEEKKEWIEFYYINDQGKRIKQIPNYLWLKEDERIDFQDSIVAFYTINNQVLTQDHKHVFRGIVIDTARNMQKYNFKEIMSTVRNGKSRFVKE